MKKKLKVEFIGEEGVDAGGLGKEWLLMVVSEVFKSEYGMLNSHETICVIVGMFTYYPETDTYFFSQLLDSEDGYYFVGMACFFLFHVATNLRCSSRHSNLQQH